jgi:hypothetical protein
MNFFDAIRNFLSSLVGRRKRRVDSSPYKERALKYIEGNRRISLKKGGGYTLRKNESRVTFTSPNGGPDDERQPKPRIKHGGHYRRIGAKHGGGLTIEEGATVELSGTLWGGESILRLRKGSHVQVRENLFILGHPDGGHDVLMHDDTTFEVLEEGEVWLIDCPRGIYQSYLKHGPDGPDDDPQGVQRHPKGSRIMNRGKVYVVNSGYGELRHPKDTVYQGEHRLIGDSRGFRARDDGKESNIR